MSMNKLPKEAFLAWNHGVEPLQSLRPKTLFHRIFKERSFVLKAGAKIKPFLISARKKINFFSGLLLLLFVLKADANLQPFSWTKTKKFKNIFRELFRFQASPLLGSQLQAYLPFVAPESGCKYTPSFELCNITKGIFPLIFWKRFWTPCKWLNWEDLR